MAGSWYLFPIKYTGIYYVRKRFNVVFFYWRQLEPSTYPLYPRLYRLVLPLGSTNRLIVKARRLDGDRHQRRDVHQIHRPFPDVLHRHGRPVAANVCLDGEAGRRSVLCFILLYTGYWFGLIWIGLGLFGDFLV